MNGSNERFYVAGGSLPLDARSYVVRAADEQLLAALRSGEFCYVLDVRQLGKSSLMVRTAAQLRQEEVTVVVLDLQAVGSPATAEEWYFGLLMILGERLDLEVELQAFWQENRLLGPLQRWMTALQRVVLPWVKGPLVFFVDEIDYVRLLPFSTDEFFAGIRECYHRRAEVPELNRLTFCLLGVATPGDLIQDVRTTPFNIGRRIELNDFSPGEMWVLAAGLCTEGRDGERLLGRIYHWTNGHPYLTQRLCQAVASDPGVMDDRGVDRLCAALFLSRKAQETESNLADVRNRMLKSEADRASLLALYERVRDLRQRVPDTETSPLVSLLRLSGIARSVEGRLQVRNRIYAAVFDRHWVRSNLPDAELRRQRAAYRRGWLRAAAVMTALAGSLAFGVASWRSQGIQKRLTARARRSESIARREAVLVRHLLYDASMNEARAAWDKGKVLLVEQLLDEQRPRRGDEDLRDFVWYYLWAQLRGAVLTLGVPPPVSSVAFSPNGSTLACGSDDGTVRLWNVATGHLTQIFAGHHGFVKPVAFSPNGSTLACGSDDGTARLWNVATGHLTQIFAGHNCWLTSIAFSPNGSILACGSWGEGPVRLWDVATGRLIQTFTGNTNRVVSVASAPDGYLVESVGFSADGSTLACWSRRGKVRLWNVATGHLIRTINPHQGSLGSQAWVAFSPNGSILAGGGWEGTVRLWNVATGRPTQTLQTGLVTWGTFSPNGRTLATVNQRTLATGNQDERAPVRLWNVATGRFIQTFTGHQGSVSYVAFSPNGRTLASGNNNGTVMLWNVATGRRTQSLQTGGCSSGSNSSVAFSPNGSTLAAPRDWDGVGPWNVATGHHTQTFDGHQSWVQSVAFSPNGSTLACGCLDETVRLWNMATGHLIQTLTSQDAGLKLLAFSPNGSLLASGRYGGPMRLWNVATGHLIQTLYPQGGVTSIAFSPNGSLLAGGSWEGPVGLWDVATGRLIQTLTSHTRDVPSVAFSPEGKSLASGSPDGTVKLWDVATGRLTLTLEDGAGDVRSVAFSPDGRTLASGNGDGTIRLWRAASPQEVPASER